MIYQQALRRELTYTTGAVFLVLITIMVTSLVIRILGFAASGSVHPKDVFVLILLAISSYIPVILTVALFIAILLVLVRWYRDSEMVVWFASGLSLMSLYKPVLRFALPLIVVIGLSALFVWPWANDKTNEITQRFKGRDEVSMVLPGQFIESNKSGRVFFIEDIDNKTDTIYNVFVTDAKDGKLSVAMAEKGNINNYPDGSKKVEIENGRRYQGQPGLGDFRILEFDKYIVEVERKEVPVVPSTPKELSLQKILADRTPANMGELLWRLGLPLMAFFLTLIAIPLAYVNPRRGNYIAMLYAVFIYLIYSNTLNISQAMVANSQHSFLMAIWPIHVLAFFFAWTLLRHRLNYSLAWWKRQLVFRSRG